MTATLLRNIRVVDVAHRAVAEPGWVRISDGVVTGRGVGEPESEPGDEHVVDGGGGYLLPGLIDTHVHIHGGRHLGPTSSEPVPGSLKDELADAAYDGCVERLGGFLHCGVTSIFDAGNDGDVMFRLRDEERAGAISSPRIFCTGPLVTCTGGHGSNLGSMTRVDSLPADAAALRAHIERGPDILKITYDEHNWGVRPLISILGPEVLRGIIEIAHEARTRVVVHVSNELRAREAIGCGADALAHPIIQSPATGEFLWQLAARKIPVSSTLAIGERYFRLADDPGFVDGPLYTECLTDAEREYLRTTEHEAQVVNRWADWMRVMTPVAQENLRALVAAGGIVAAGTDLSLGADFHRELELLQSASIPVWDVLRTATVNGAVFLGREHDMGRVEAGFVADLLCVRSDPTADVTNLRDIEFVMKSGAVVDRAALAV